MVCELILVSDLLLKLVLYSAVKSMLFLFSIFTFIFSVLSVRHEHRLTSYFILRCRIGLIMLQALWDYQQKINVSFFYFLY